MATGYVIADVEAKDKVWYHSFIALSSLLLFVLLHVVIILKDK